mgnify:CR=1 FL=1
MVGRALTRLAAAGSLTVLAVGLWMAWPPAALITVGALGLLVTGARMGVGR